jgi:hypothetical protein
MHFAHVAVEGGSYLTLPAQIPACGLGVAVEWATALATMTRRILPETDALSIPKHSYIQSLPTEPLFPATDLALKFPRAC